jgi:hypothetical protein
MTSTSGGRASTHNTLFCPQARGPCTLTVCSRAVRPAGHRQCRPRARPARRRDPDERRAGIIPQREPRLVPKRGPLDPRTTRDNESQSWRDHRCGGRPSPCQLDPDARPWGRRPSYDLEEGDHVDEPVIGAVVRSENDSTLLRHHLKAWWKTRRAARQQRKRSDLGT